MGLGQGFNCLVLGDGGRWATLAWFLPYGFYAEYEYDVRIRIMASHELSLVEQMSQAEGELLLVTLPHLFSGESVLDLLKEKK